MSRIASLESFTLSRSSRLCFCSRTARSFAAASASRFRSASFFSCGRTYHPLESESLVGIRDFYEGKRPFRIGLGIKSGFLEKLKVSS